MLRTFYDAQSVEFGGVMTGALDIAGPGQVLLSNSNNDFSSLNLRGGRLDNFNSNRNDIDINIIEGTHLRNATLGSAGAFTGTLTIDGQADITIADGFYGTLDSNGSAIITADTVGGYVRSTGSTSVRANNISGLRTDANDGTIRISSLGSELLVDREFSSVGLRAYGQGSVVVEDALTVTSDAGIDIYNNGRQVRFSGVLNNSGNINIAQNFNSNNYYNDYRADDGIHWNLNNNGSVYAYGKVFGSMTNTANGSISMNGTNMGVIDNTAGGQLRIVYLDNQSQVMSDNITTDGQVYNRSGSTIDVTGAYTQNGGHLSSWGQVTAGSMVVNDGSVYVGSDVYGSVDDGTMHVTNDVVQNGGRLTVDGDLFATTVELNGGTATMSGSGTIHADVQVNDGQLNPGNSPGNLSIEGDFTLSANGTLLMEIGGLLVGTQHDVLDISGNAYLGGTLDVDLYDFGSGLFSAELGDTFDILMAETIVGEFDYLSLAVLGNGLGWDLSYILDDFGTDYLSLSVVQVSSVPVPSAVWLFGSGLIGLVGFARRKKV